MSKKAKGLKSKEAKYLIANFQYPKTSRCAAIKNSENVKNNFEW